MLLFFGGGGGGGGSFWFVHVWVCAYFQRIVVACLFFTPSQPVQLHQSEFAEKVTLTYTLTLHGYDACGMSNIHSLQANMTKCISHD